MDKNETIQKIDLRDLMLVFIKRFWVCVLSILMTIVVTGYYSYFILDDYYSSMAVIYLGKDNSMASIDIGIISLSNQLVTDYLNLINSRMVAQEVIDELGIDLPVESLQNKVKGDIMVTPDTNYASSRMFSITYRSTNPQLAADITNTTAKVVIEKASEIFGVKNAQIIDAALVAERPEGPDRIQIILIAASVGFIMGIMLILIIEFMDNTFRNKEEVENYLGITVLSEIPKYKSSKKTVSIQVQEQS